MQKELCVYLNKFDKSKCKKYNYTSVFLFVKHYCPHSRHASSLAEEKCPGNVVCLNLVKDKSGKINYVTPNDLYQTLLFQEKKIAKAKSKMATALSNKFQKCKFTTVPQIFVYGQEGWKYVGGRDDFDAFTKSSSTVASIQTSFQAVKF